VWNFTFNRFLALLNSSLVILVSDFSSFMPELIRSALCEDDPESFSPKIPESLKEFLKG